MSDPTLFDNDFQNEMVWVWTSLEYTIKITHKIILKAFVIFSDLLESFFQKESVLLSVQY